MPRNVKPCRLCFLFALAGAFFPLLAYAVSPTCPGVEWSFLLPAEAGMDATALDQLSRELAGRRKTGPPGGMVIRYGYVVKAWGRFEEPNQWHSATKTVLSTLLLFALHEGRIQSVDDKVLDLGFKLEDRHKGMTLRHLANMTSGYGRPEGSGEAFSYNDYAIKLYYLTLKKVFDTGSLLDVFKTRIAEPLGFEDKVEGLGEGRLTVGHKMRMSARDWARVHLFWLNKFRWKETQILPAEYFDLYIKPQVSPNLLITVNDGKNDDYLGIGTAGGDTNFPLYTRYGPGIYGFNFWFNGAVGRKANAPAWPNLTRKSFLTIGSRGNVSAVIPEYHLILISAQGPWELDFEAGDPGGKYNSYFKLLLEAVE